MRVVRVARIFLTGLSWIVAQCIGHVASVQAEDVGNWPQWRGPLGTGEATYASPPVEWTDEQNVRWKTKLPGRGHSTPILWGDHIFITTAIPVGEKLPPKMSGRPGAHDNLAVDSKFQFVVLALDRDSGTILWRRVVREAIPLEGGHKSASLASASPVTDGQRVYAHFGSHGVYCLDFEGKLLWQKDFGPMHTKHGHGEGSSPALYGDALIINWDHEEQSALIVLDKTTGKLLWRRERDEVTSWSTPIVVSHDGIEQVIVCGTDRVRGYDLATGKTIWECGGMSANIVATPVVGGGMLYVGSSYEKRALLAIRLEGAEADITNTSNVVWSRTRGTPYVPSLLLLDGGLYFLAHYQNILTRVDAMTGQESPGPMRLGALSSIYASPVAAAGNVYVTDLEGTTMVISGGEIPRAVSVNPLGENVNASLAIAGNRIFIRGEHHLFCIAQE